MTEYYIDVYGNYVRIVKLPYDPQLLLGMIPPGFAGRVYNVVNNKFAVEHNDGKQIVSIGDYLIFTPSKDILVIKEANEQYIKENFGRIRFPSDSKREVCTGGQYVTGLVLEEYLDTPDNRKRVAITTNTDTHYAYTCGKFGHGAVVVNVTDEVAFKRGMRVY